MSFTAVLLVFVVFTGIVWAIHKGRLKKSETGEDNAHFTDYMGGFFPIILVIFVLRSLLPNRSKFRPAPCVRAWSKAILSW